MLDSDNKDNAIFVWIQGLTINLFYFQRNADIIPAAKFALICILLLRFEKRRKFRVQKIYVILSLTKMNQALIYSSLKISNNTLKSSKIYRKFILFSATASGKNVVVSNVLLKLTPVQNILIILQRIITSFVLIVKLKSVLAVNSRGKNANANLIKNKGEI